MPIVDLSGATFQRAIAPDVASTNGGLVAEVTVAETHDDELIITDHPVELGAMMSDHAYKRPPQLRLRVGWSNAYGGYAAYAQAIYAQLLALQVLRQPFQVYTGKRFYTNMLVGTIREETTEKTEYVALFDITLRQVFLVSTQTTSSSVNPNPANQAQPQNTTPTVDSGQQQAQPVTSFNQLRSGNSDTTIPTGDPFQTPSGPSESADVPNPQTNSNGGGVSSPATLDQTYAFPGSF